ncbi:hypothetical protein OPV22_010593 [Ensete ventricosum]|uniref:Uncharacterized protein n=1 Tax=Ensete ventricosum TaxID=4639 RepID=A0AAV8RBN2_ENSVE|nr:hypothetical protein OPV22_010593 [Ensete ventricosum]
MVADRKMHANYWGIRRLESFLESGDGTEQSDHEKHGDASSGKDPAFPEERFFVIMAGDCTPTFFAIPIASRAVDNRTDADENNDGENKRMYACMHACHSFA